MFLEDFFFYYNSINEYKILRNVLNEKNVIYKNIKKKITY